VRRNNNVAEGFKELVPRVRS